MLRPERAAKPPEKLPTQAGDRIQIIKGDLKDQFVKPDMLETGARPIELPSNNTLT